MLGQRVLWNEVCLMVSVVCLGSIGAPVVKLFVCGQCWVLVSLHMYCKL